MSISKPKLKLAKPKLLPAQRHHKAVMKQLTSISLDVAATLVAIGTLNATVTRLHELARRRDEQTDRLIALMQQFADRDRILRGQVEAKRYMAGRDVLPSRFVHSGVPGGGMADVPVLNQEWGE